MKQATSETNIIATQIYFLSDILNSAEQFDHLANVMSINKFQNNLGRVFFEQEPLMIYNTSEY